MIRSTLALRAVAATLAPGLLLAGCQVTRVNHHSSQGLAPSLQVRARWESAWGKRLVGGLLCQVVRKEEGRAPRLVAAAKTTEEIALQFPGLAPGRYRLVVHGAGPEKLVEELELAAGERATVRVDARAAAGSRFAIGPICLSKPVREGLKGLGLVLLVVAVVGGSLVLGVDLGDDDDD